MKKQVIFFDVDGTLVDGNTGIISPSTKKALKQLKDVGHLVCIATGRSICSLQEGGFLEILDWDGYVCNTGQMIYDRHLQLIQEQYIDAQAVQTCMQLAKEDGLVSVSYTHLYQLLIFQTLHHSFLLYEAVSKSFLLFLA